MVVRALAIGVVVVAGATTAGGATIGDRYYRAVGSTDTSGIEGQVVIRPVRPVQRKGDANQRPYQTTISILDPSGHLVTTVDTDSAGAFRVMVPPGTYVLRPHQSGTYPRANEQRVTVTRGKMTHVDVAYDSGMR